MPKKTRSKPSVKPESEPKVDALQAMRHSCAHLLAAAVLRIYPDTKLAIGPAIEDGFYYDFEFSKPISENDLPKIEKMMKKTLQDWKAFSREDVTIAEAKEREKDQPYKLDLIEEFSKTSKTVSFYTSGRFTDLCRGGHIENPKEMGPFKLLKLAGAYWRGDEKNKQLTRIYGTCFATEVELDGYLKRQEDAKERDHRKLGKELDLFTFSPEYVGAGLPLWTPRGTVLRMALQDRLLQISKRYGMQPVTIPHIAKRKLYETSGHAAKFGDELIQVHSHYDEFVMKPVNCPHHIQIYASRPRSYRDLPIRYMETTMQYRDEQPGEISGLTRVRAITVDDGHIFLRPDQIKEEAKRIANIIKEFYTSFGLYGDHWVSLSVRDPKTPEKYIGDEKDWNTAEKMLQEVSDDLGLNAQRMEGEAALYGPKLDYMFKDSLGRVWQLATIQIDFAMPKRFGIEYADSDGAAKTPVILHRAILGSYERFLAILIEHFAGNFPTWLAPVQVAVLPISDKHVEYAQKIAEILMVKDIRVEVSDMNETIGAKIRNATKMKVPYMLIVGDKEVEASAVAVRTRDGKDHGQVAIETFISDIEKEIQSRSL
jgi:threonyl-tRNA synthetase